MTADLRMTSSMNPETIGGHMLGAVIYRLWLCAAAKIGLYRQPSARSAAPTTAVLRQIGAAIQAAKGAQEPSAPCLHGQSGQHLRHRQLHTAVQLS